VHPRYMNLSRSLKISAPFSCGMSSSISEPSDPFSRSPPPRFFMISRNTELQAETITRWAGIFSPCTRNTTSAKVGLSTSSTKLFWSCSPNFCASNSIPTAWPCVELQSRGHLRCQVNNVCVRFFHWHIYWWCATATSSSSRNSTLGVKIIK